jgi:hypothetical protein
LSGVVSGIANAAQRGDIDEQRDLKIALVEKAQNDPLFLSDIVETKTDFETSDHTTVL